MAASTSGGCRKSRSSPRGRGPRPARLRRWRRQDQAALVRASIHTRRQGKASRSGWQKVRFPTARTGPAPPRGGHPPGIGEGVLDGHRHIRHPQLGHHRVVLILDHGVDDALPVDHHLDAVLRQIKEPGRLDDLQALVHHGGGVDGDFGAHVPVGVAQGLLPGDGRKLLRGSCRRRGRPRR